MSAGTDRKAARRDAQVEQVAKEFEAFMRGEPEFYVEIAPGRWMMRADYEKPLRRWEDDGGTPE